VPTKSCRPESARVPLGSSRGQGKRTRDSAREGPIRSRPSGVPFGYEKVAPGIYKVQPQAELKAGERLPLRRECADGSMQAFRLWHRGSGISTGHNKCDSAGRAKG